MGLNAEAIPCHRRGRFLHDPSSLARFQLNVPDTRAEQAQRAPKNRISVLVVTADNMTSELLKNAFAHGRSGFTVDTLTGSSQKIIGELESHKADVTLISEELQDGPEAGMKVLQKTRDSNDTSAIMLLQSSKPERVVNAFRDGARGVFYRSHSLKSLSKCIQAVHRDKSGSITKMSNIF